MSRGWIKEFQSSLPRQFDEKRNVKSIRRYGYWVKYNEGGELKETGDYWGDEVMAKKFFEYTSSYWNRIQQCFPRHRLSKVFRDLT